MRLFFKKFKQLSFNQWCVLIAVICLMLITVKIVFFFTKELKIEEDRKGVYWGHESDLKIWTIKLK